MRRQILRFAAAIPVVLLFIATASPKSYHASRFDVALGIQGGGDVLITETVDFRFEGGPYRYVFREIPFRESDGLDQFQAFMDGQEVRIGAGEMPGMELERKRNAIRLTWHFQPTSDTLHSFAVKYRARGAVRRGPGIDLLLWKAIPGDHEYRIESGQVTVTYPPGVQLLGEPTADRKTTVATSAETITYDAGPLNKNHGFSVNVPFAPGSILTRPPMWQQEDERRSAEIWNAVKIAMAVEIPLLLVGILLIVRLRSGSGAPHVGGPSVLTSPPDDLPPTLVGVVRGSWTDWRVALATLIDLGQRGFLEIEAQPKRWYAGREFKLRRKSDPGGLNEVEQVLLRLVFGTAQAYAPEVPLRKAQRHISRRWRQFTRVVEEEAKAAGFLDADRDSARLKWIVTGLLIMLFSLTGIGVSLITILPQVRFAPIVVALSVGFGFFMLGLVILILGSTMTRLSDAALRRKQGWDAFRKHLKELVSHKGQLRPDWLDAYLPYAVVLGIGSQWAKAFKDQGISTHLSWLVGTDQFDGSELAALVAVLSSSGAGTSTPGGGAAGGAGGGGGSSGAG